jgi:hypothetical protein
MGWTTWNLVSTIGAFTLGLSFLVFLGNWIWSVRHGEPAGDDPWDARTLEWSIPSPPPAYNFAVVPRVESRDDWWHQKYAEEDGVLVRRIAGAAGADAPDAARGTEARHIHLPSPSYHPLLVALGLPLLGYGLTEHWIWFAPGALLAAWGLVGWLLEPPSE